MKLIDMSALDLHSFDEKMCVSILGQHIFISTYLLVAVLVDTACLAVNACFQKVPQDACRPQPDIR